MAPFYLDRAKRFEISAPVTFWWSYDKAPAKSGKGITRNISKSGIMVTASECPPAGARIQMNVRIPQSEDRKYGMELHGEGTVVRVDEDAAAGSGAKPKRFAASVQFYPEPMEASGRRR